MRPITTAEQIISAIQLLRADFDHRPTHQVQGKGGKLFEFFPTSITDNIPPLHPNVSRAVCLLSEFHLLHSAQATLGVGEEDRGAMIISDILLHYDLPRTLARWTPSGAPGEVAVGFSNEYIREGEASIYLNGIMPGDQVILVDDLISTGGTLAALVQAVRQAGATILEILTIGEKTENGGREFLKKTTGIEIKTIMATSLEKRGDKIHSKVLHVNLGRMTEPLFSSVAQAFPAGFCRLGSG